MIPHSTGRAAPAARAIRTDRVFPASLPGNAAAPAAAWATANGRRSHTERPAGPNSAAGAADPVRAQRLPEFPAGPSEDGRHPLDRSRHRAQRCQSSSASSSMNSKASAPLPSTKSKSSASSSSEESKSSRSGNSAVSYFSMVPSMTARTMSVNADPP